MKIQIRTGLLVFIFSALAACAIWANNHPAYKALKLEVARSASVQAMIGPVRSFHMVSFSVGTIGSPNAPTYQSADVALYAVGPKGRANICAVLRKYGDQWEPTIIDMDGIDIENTGIDGVDPSCLAKARGVFFSLPDWN